VTFVPRVLPLMVMSRFALPQWVMQWLGYVPVAVMAALVGQEVLTQDGKIMTPWENLDLWAAILAFAAAVITRSLLVTVLTGVIVLMLLRYFLPG
jgi:branched-subunit amino acid transport protein